MNRYSSAHVIGHKLAHTNFSLRLTLCVPLLGWSLLTAAQTPVMVAGVLRGQQAVSESGSAEYRVPLQVPPGTAGMQPKLALSYNSQSGNGLLGMGWNLEGLSIITRCPRTMASDGVRGGVNLDANDRYCLDGQRLVVVSGSYGAASSEYRTEREIFSKVVAVGSAGAAPQSFVVKTKSGLTMEYGATADSRIEAQGKSEVRVWALNKVQDTKGNYLTISYTEDNVNGDYRPDRIDYSGNQAAGLAPAQSVRFLYQSRTDVVPLYQSGSLVKATMRLSNVQTYAKVGTTDTLVHDYRLEYEGSPATARSRLNKISQCNAANECLQPIQLGWQGPTSAQAAFTFSRSLPGAAAATNSYIDATHKEIITGDFNGDGRIDLLHLHPSADPQYSWVALANSSGGFTFSRSLPGAAAATNSYIDASYKNIVSGDFNGDGLTDLLHLHPNADPQYSWVALAKGDGTFAFTRSLPGAAAATNSYIDTSNLDIITGDFNGDGRTDLLHLQASSDPQYSWVALSSGNGTFTFMRSLPGAAAATNSYLDSSSKSILSGDFNGDGLTDLLHLHPNADPQYSWVALSKGDGSFTFSRKLPGAAAVTNSYLDASNLEIVMGDFNGDGLTDMLHLQPNADPQYSWVALSKGDGSFTFTRSLPGAAAAINSYLDASNREISVGDFNGDGLTDLLHLQASADAQYSWVALSKGDGTFTFGRSLPGAAAATNSYLDSSNKVVISGDFNGDGRTDLLHLQPSADTQYSWVAINQGAIPDFLSQLSAGDGSATVSYKPLTDGSVYTKASTLALYPRMDVQVPMYVVSAVSRSNGIGGNNTTEYRYGELKLSVGTGRGLLGFKWTKNTELVTGIETYTKYRQSFPYTGMPITTEQRLTGSGNGGVITRTSYAVDCQNPQTMATCVIAAGNRYFTYVTQSVEEGWDLNGAVLPVTTSTYIYGQSPQYGDPTQVSVGSSTGGTKTAVNTYSNDETNWILGRLTRAQVTSSTDATPPGTLPQVQAASFFNFNQTISTNTLNYNLMADVLVSGWDQDFPINAKVTVATGVYVGSANTGQPAFSTGSNFPAGSTLELINNGSILGRGGRGGLGYWYATTAQKAGENGGIALSAQHGIAIQNNGTIGGGGGGGGAGGSTTVVDECQGFTMEGAGGGGGGGAGSTPGLGGGAIAFWGSMPTPGSAGTNSAGGNGGPGSSVSTCDYVVGGGGGIGGGIGGSGSSGSAGDGSWNADFSKYLPGSGGVGGAAVIGNSNITWITTGTRLGAVQ